MRGTFFKVAALAAALGFSAPALAVDGSTGGLNEQLQLNTSITVTGKDVHLGDIFTGYLSRPEKVVAQAPRPGQRMVLSSEWLSRLAHTYGLNWQPDNAYDRAVVYQPGQAISAENVLASLKAELIAKGMPSNYSILPSTPVPTVTIESNAAIDIGVREAYFDARTKTFSAVVEIPPGSPSAQFLNLRGAAFPVVNIPVLKESAAKNTVITAAMIKVIDFAEDQMRADTITDAHELIGKAPKVFVRSNQPIRETEVAQMTLVEVPVLTTDARRDGTIVKSNITLATFNAADLPSDVVTEPQQLIGRTPRRMLTAGTPLRRGDVQLTHQVQVSVASHDIARGDVLEEKDVMWVTMNDSEVVANAITNAADLVGRVTKHPLRSGQALRSYDIERPLSVIRGKLVTILWSAPQMNLTVQGLALESGGVGDVIRVSNTKSKTTVMAEIIDAGTVRITTQTASR